MLLKSILGGSQQNGGWLIGSLLNKQVKLFVYVVMWIMNLSYSVFPILRAMVLALVLILVGSIPTAYCQGEVVTLVIQQTPIRGGTISPSAGIHHFARDSQVILTAVAQSGYQFSYWLGDVGDPTANRTTVYLNGPKVVVAVFEPLERESLAEASSVGRGGGGAAIPAAGDFGHQGWSDLHGSGRSVQQPSLPRFPAAAIPEPATILLLGLGAAALRKSRRRRCC